MSMSIVLAEFDVSDDKLLADYRQVGVEVLMTDFLDGIVSDQITDNLVVFEGGEEIVYKQFQECVLPGILNILERECLALFGEIRKVKGAEKVQEILSHIEDVSRLSILVGRYYIRSSIRSTEVVKLLIA